MCRKQNSLSEFTDQRNHALLQKFRESLAKQSQISLKKAFKEAADAPAPRFWVSEGRALEVIRKLLAGEDATIEMWPMKARMYREIFERVKEQKEKNPRESLPDIVFRVVNSPAPCSYITPDYTRKLINSCRRRKNLTPCYKKDGTH